MNKYVTGDIIRKLRERSKLTQAQLADKICVSNKTVSKWENGNGLPDISLLEPLAEALGVSLIELMTGTEVKNENVNANYSKAKWYVCPVCGNVIQAMGEAVVSCCGITLPSIEEEEDNEGHVLQIERVEDEYFVSIDHEMTKQHYICFIAYITASQLQVEKLYPEQEASVRFKISGHGRVICYCNHHGMFSKRI